MKSSTLRALASLLALTLLVASAVRAEQTTERRAYRIQHQVWGDIGTLTEKIRSDGAATRVTTEIDVRVALFGLTLHSVHGEWNEVWQGGFLQRFDATTLANGKREITEGRKCAGIFVIRAGGRRIDAPASVQPINPWSLQFVRASTLMSPETGRLIPAAIRDEGMMPLRLNGTVVHLHHYVVNADGVHHLYFDAEGTLVQFEFADPTGRATVTLIRPGATNIAAAG